MFCRNLSSFAIFRKLRSDGPLTLSFFGVAGDFWRRLLLQIEYYIMCLRSCANWTRAIYLNFRYILIPRAPLPFTFLSL